MMPIAQSNPGRNYRAHHAEIEASMARVLASGWYILGQEVAAFEQEFAAFIGAHFAIAVGSGTDALVIALRSCGVGSGDRVVTVAHTAVATVAAIELAGAVPVLLDIDPATFTMDVSGLADLLRDSAMCGGQKIKAIIPVHLYGHPADMPAIMALARQYGQYVIEDCAQSHGATFAGRTTGAWGELGAFSFYPTKNLGALGDGGAVVTNDLALAEKIRSLREYGWQERYISHRPGMNTRLDELQAAILRVKLQHLTYENERRREVARIYDRLLGRLPLCLPKTDPRVAHVFHQYVVRHERRDELRAFLKENGVSSLIHYPVPVHLQPAYQGRIEIASGGLKHTEQAACEVLSLPMHPHLTEAEAECVGEGVAHWCDPSGQS